MLKQDMQHLANSLRHLRMLVNSVRERSTNDGRILLAITSALSDFGGTNTATELQRVHYSLLGLMNTLEHVSKRLKDRISFVENYDDSYDDSDDECDDDEDDDDEEESDENDDQK